MSRHILKLNQTEYPFELVPQPTSLASVPLKYEVHAHGVEPFMVYFPMHLQTAKAFLKEAYLERERM